jgi:hypothetical protein
MIPLRLNPDGVQIPVPSMNPHEIVGMLGGQLPVATIFTWVEVAMALSSRDVQIGFLERRIADLEKQLGVEPVSFETFMQEAQAEYEAAMAKAEAEHQAQQQEGAAPPQGTPPGHGMPGGQPR